MFATPARTPPPRRATSASAPRCRSPTAWPARSTGSPRRASPPPSPPDDPDHTIGGPRPALGHLAPRCHGSTRGARAPYAGTHAPWNPNGTRGGEPALVVVRPDGGPVSYTHLRA